MILLEHISAKWLKEIGCACDGSNELKLSIGELFFVCDRGQWMADSELLLDPIEINYTYEALGLLAFLGVSGVKRKSPEPEAFRPCFPQGIESMKHYAVKCDDTGREKDSTLSILVSEDGDVWASMSAYMDDRRDQHSQLSVMPSIRIRTGVGGGRMRRTRQALLWLAKAIMEDSKENGIEC